MSARRLTTLLWTINLSAISASMFVYLYLAQHAYHSLGSLLVSELVLVAPLVMPVLLAFQLNQVAARVGPRKLLFAANAAGACYCAVLFLATDLGTVSVLLGAAVVGALVYSALCRHQRAPGLAVVTPVCAIAMLAACELPGVAASFASYFVFFFCFELAFFRLQGDIVLATPPADMPLVATLQYALVYAGLMLTGAIGALLVGPIGLSGTALCLALGYFAGQALLRRLARRIAAPAIHHHPGLEP